MPLSFNSKSHGNIAFGFFNIETDMLLLEDLFFFANHFCHKIIDLAEQSNNSSNSVILEGFCINDRIKIGNLHNAIQGVNFTGFIGETYSKFPFPSNPEGFKQKNSPPRPFGPNLLRQLRSLHTYQKVRLKRFTRISE